MFVLSLYKDCMKNVSADDIIGQKNVQQNQNQKHFNEQNLSSQLQIMLSFNLFSNRLSKYSQIFSIS